MSERMSDERLNQCRLICSGEILDSLVAERDRVRELEAEVARLKLERAAELERPQYSICAKHPWLTATSVLGAAHSCPACCAEAAEAKVARVEAVLPRCDWLGKYLLEAALQEPEHE